MERRGNTGKEGRGEERRGKRESMQKRLVRGDRTRKVDVAPHWRNHKQYSSRMHRSATLSLSLHLSSLLPTYEIIELRFIRLVEHAKQTVYHPAFDLKLRMARFEYINGGARDAEAEEHEDKHDRHKHGPPGGVVAYERVYSVGERGSESSERMMRVWPPEKASCGMWRRYVCGSEQPRGL